MSEKQVSDLIIAIIVAIIVAVMVAVMVANTAIMPETGALLQNTLCRA